ncbi:CPBP family intramembrane metalloprotease [Ferruginibacter lapsinanis]|uniref:CPBP family intramembrane glutamic endopeptidase n=1 Tax=Ferruginibacter lapsinanis TaxID=563172 RepID=UPI001E296DE9|nr:CPBP family intramembrane glutamic endopeptidase [Ferruginibacter lapsinanis]UEG51017.1 CPBP family intramembrane metalloprotease [Ferruginibacter lapsinanis]
MQYKSIKGYTGAAQLGILLAFVGAGLLLAGAVQTYFGYRAIGTSSVPFSQLGDAMLKALMKPENAVYMQLSQIFGTFFLMFVPSAGFILLCHKKISWAGFTKHFNLFQIVLAFIIILCTTLFANPFADMSKAVFAHFPHWDMLAKNAEKMYNDAVASMSGLNTWPQFFVGMFIVAFLPALFEELFFRGTMQNFFMRWWKNPVLAIVVTSIVFSFIHASYYLFISRFILGCALGMLFYYSKNIWVNTFAHFMNNLMALSQLFYLNRTKGGKVDVNNMDTPMPLWSLLIASVILVALFILFKNISKHNREKIELAETETSADNAVIE